MADWRGGRNPSVTIPIQPGTELAINWHRGSCVGTLCPMGSPGHQQGFCCSLGAQGSVGAWPPTPGAASLSHKPANLQICCQLEESEQFHQPWSSEVFLKKKVVLFGYGILLSKAGVKAVAIIMGKNKMDALQALSCSFSCSRPLLPYKIPGAF